MDTRAEMITQSEAMTPATQLNSLVHVSKHLLVRNLIPSHSIFSFSICVVERVCSVENFIQ